MPAFAHHWCRALVLAGSERLPHEGNRLAAEERLARLYIACVGAGSIARSIIVAGSNFCSVAVDVNTGRIAVDGDPVDPEPRGDVSYADCPSNQQRNGGWYGKPT